MDIQQTIEQKIHKGYMKIERGKQLSGCDEWLSAWEDIKSLCQTSSIGVLDLDKEFKWKGLFISNYVQDMEMELGNAGIDDEKYHQKRINYCNELLPHCNKDQQIRENTQRAIADAHCSLGDYAECDRLYESFLEADPDWGWGYIGWSDCYWLFDNNKQYDKAEEILERALSRKSLRDRIDVVERAIDLSGECENHERKKALQQEFHKLQITAPKKSFYHKEMPVLVEKIGRNEPCPCGSGKKHKKCCGAGGKN